MSSGNENEILEFDSPLKLKQSSPSPGSDNKNIYCIPFLLTFDLNSQLLRGGDRHGVPGPSAGPGLRRDGQLHGGGLDV